jgi:GTPase SAR1 family protein
MAGSGKTTFLQRLNAHLHERALPGYIINLDPAVASLPYSPNVDIRDTVNYKNVMAQYSLGPNGAILTSLNLFATRFDQVVALAEKPRDPPTRYVVADTPGQIEIFTWSASGAIITEAFASALPTMVAFVVDTPRCAAPQTFVANMLQAVSILYKTRLPLLLVFNKCDVARPDFAREWMADWDAFAAALEADASYAATLARSMSLVLEEFYAGLRSVGVSAVTGEGMDEFLAAADACGREYAETYAPELAAAKARRAEEEAARRAADLERVRADAGGGGGGGGAGSAPRGRVVLDALAEEEIERSSDEEA